MHRFRLPTFSPISAPALALLLLGASAEAGPATSPAAIPMPPCRLLESALRSIEDPLLAAEVSPGRDYGAADCVVHLGLYRPLATAEQRAAIDRASAAWRASLVREMGEIDAQQMIGSSVNPLIPTPPPLRQAAAAWCVANAPTH
jgi:hypothetical protein